MIKILFIFPFIFANLGGNLSMKFLKIRFETARKQIDRIFFNKTGAKRCEIFTDAGVNEYRSLIF
jgi:hypothetical protein